MIELSFIVPTYNSEKTIAATLNSIFSQVQELKFEVIIVDNGSEDNTKEIVTQFPAVLLNEHTRGANHARNLGIKHAKGELIAFIDSDVILDPHWSQNLINYMQRKNLQAAQGMIIRSVHTKENILERYRAHGSSIEIPRTCINLVGPGLQIGFINTAACIYRMSTLRSVHYFSTFYRYFEDIDLTLKVRSLFGSEIGCTQEAKAFVYYTNGYLAYFKRTFVHGFYLPFLEEKWKHQKNTPSYFKTDSPSLQLFHNFILTINRTGRMFGSIAIRLNKPSILKSEIKKTRKFSSLGQLKESYVYFEDQILKNIER
jgi:glycosyltransferase involved in cell wall biosynthesis